MGAAVIAGFAALAEAAEFESPIELSTLNGATGFKLNGVAEDDTAGFSVGPAGDVNGDGFGDIIVGAYLADTPGSSQGAAYVVFGQASGLGPEIDLSALDGTTGFALIGAEDTDQAGASVTSAGDVNGDGYGDLIIGAYREGADRGAAYVVFGKPGVFDFGHRSGFRRWRRGLQDQWRGGFRLCRHICGLGGRRQWRWLQRCV